MFVHSLRLTIGVISQKGGVGKSTLASNLAAAAHLSGLRTVVLDPDPQGSLVDWQAARPKGSKLAGLDVKAVGDSLTEARFLKLTAGYEVAVLDGEPRLNDIAHLSAMASDVVLIPIRVGGFNWWASAQTIDLLDGVDKARAALPTPRPPLRRVLVLSEALERTRLGQSALKALEQLGDEAPLARPLRRGRDGGRVGAHVRGPAASARHARLRTAGATWRRGRRGELAVGGVGARRQREPLAQRLARLLSAAWTARGTDRGHRALPRRPLDARRRAR